jgi:hypothetical protein
LAYFRARRLGINEALEPALVGQAGMRVEELQLAGAVGIREHRQHLAAEQARQHVAMHEEVWPRRDPSLAVEREPSARHDHVHVRMDPAKGGMRSALLPKPSFHPSDAGACPA